MKKDKEIKQIKSEIKSKKICWNCGAELEDFKSDGELCINCENFRNLYNSIYQ